jgi:hypothetical protein
MPSLLHRCELQAARILLVEYFQLPRRHIPGEVDGKVLLPTGTMSDHQRQWERRTPHRYWSLPKAHSPYPRGRRTNSRHRPPCSWAAPLAQAPALPANLGKGRWRRAEVEAAQPRQLGALLRGQERGWLPYVAELGTLPRCNGEICGPLDWLAFAAKGRLVQKRRRVDDRPAPPALQGRK